MSGHKYTTNSGNLFDDETFMEDSLRARASNPFNGQRLSFQQQKKVIEEQTLASSNRSLSLLYETEHVGIATSGELVRQREQLERTNQNLDDIDVKLDSSQKHLNGMKSIFGRFKSAVSRPKSIHKDLRPLSQGAQKPNIGEKRNSTTSTFHRDAQSFSNIREVVDGVDSLQHTQSTSDSSFNQQLNRNLNDMMGSLSRLKGMATDLQQEIDLQNDLIDDITTKADKVDSKIGKQNKEIKRLLG